MTAAAARHSVHLGSVEIPYTVTVRPRRHLSISVHPNLEVAVVAPASKSMQQIETKVRQRAPWILRQQMRFQDLHPLPTPRRFVSGATHRYLGRQYRLKVIERRDEGVRLDRPFLVVAAHEIADAETVALVLSRWMRSRAEEVLPRHFERVLSAYPSLRTAATSLRIRRMAQRWGSCAASGVISLNPDLVRAPPSCIDYVIVHELCHRRVMNHGPRFVRLLTAVMPDWARRRERLNQLCL